LAVPRRTLTTVRVVGAPLRGGSAGVARTSELNRGRVRALGQRDVAGVRAPGLTDLRLAGRPTRARCETRHALRMANDR